jgi:hypothetical protein
MQTEPCALCGATAIAWYPVRSLDALTMTEQRRRLPLCEPHRAWLEGAGARGRPVGEAGRWWLDEDAASD